MLFVCLLVSELMYVVCVSLVSELMYVMVCVSACFRVDVCYGLCLLVSELMYAVVLVR